MIKTSLELLLKESVKWEAINTDWSWPNLPAKQETTKVTQEMDVHTQ